MPPFIFRGEELERTLDAPSVIVPAAALDAFANAFGMLKGR